MRHVAAVAVVAGGGAERRRLLVAGCRRKGCPSVFNLTCGVLARAPMQALGCQVGILRKGLHGSCKCAARRALRQIKRKNLWYDGLQRAAKEAPPVCMGRRHAMRPFEAPFSPRTRTLHLLITSSTASTTFPPSLAPGSPQLGIAPPRGLQPCPAPRSLRRAPPSWKR